MMVRLIIGIVIGGLLGYAMYRFIGCSSGACPITSDPWISTILGMVFGALVAKAQRRFRWKAPRSILCAMRSAISRPSLLIRADGRF